MFNLDEAVSGWRDGLKDADALSALDVTELESHLREEAARVEALGLTAEEAFVIASRRIGSPHVLNIEYEKADPAQAWRRRMFWFVLGVFGYWVWTGLTSTLASSVFPLVRAGYISGATAGATFMLTWGAMMAVAIRVLILLSRGELTQLTAAIQKRYRKRYSLLTDIAVLAMVVLLVRTGSQILISDILSGLSVTSAHQFDVYRMSYAFWASAVATAIASPVVIGFLLFLFNTPRRASTE